MNIIIKDSIELNNNIELFNFKVKQDKEKSIFDNINVAIAASITSYARVKVSED
jgi:uncharacterized protein YkuJ